MTEAVDLDSDLFELAMSAQAQPLMDAVKRHITENVAPIGLAMWVSAVLNYICLPTGPQSSGDDCCAPEHH